ncbi:chemotaxis protein [uncultured Bartonella sp.]|uniref:chemotaxis protein n=1 Tax=uncultured Bartonella sp. TaxID=104108 RepID=UPI00262A16F4|nr:chemotaxis protein [uncultured Bartonella sp.]
MINRLLKMIFVAGGALPFMVAIPVHAQMDEQSTGPVQLVRSLETLQDDIASGQPGALQMQPRVIAEIGQKFLTEEPSTWKNKKNFYAALTYLFNGGNPAVVETIIKNTPDTTVPKNYIDGALAFVHHKTKNFLKAFNDLPTDNTDVPAALLLAITLNTVDDMAEDTPEKASNRLDWVRLVAPGSLFEEAAIRRQIKVASLINNTKLFRMLTRNYVTRFSKSSYENEFWRDFLTALAHMDSRLSDEQLSEFVAFAPKKFQLVIYLQISRNALIDARMPRAHFCAQKAIDLARDLGVDDTVARLYYAASSVGSTAAEDAGEMLKTISVSRLPERDRPLLMAAMTVAKGVVSDLPVLPKGQDDDEEIGVADGTVKDPGEQKEKNSDEILPVPTVNPVSRRDEKKMATEIDQFMQQTKKKLDEVDKLLEKK